MADVDGTPDRYDRDGVEFGRSLAYMDATFAIATTLLVTTLDPTAREWSNWSRFWDSEQGPLLAFALSFLVISSFWWANHRMVSTLRALSPRFVLRSLVLLAFVALVPFTTEGLGEFTDASLQVSTVVYALNIAAVSLASTSLTVAAYRDGLFRRPPEPAVFRRRGITPPETPPVFPAPGPGALFIPGTAARLMWLALILTGGLSARWLRQPAGSDG